ncbi:MAG: YdcF family protein [Steroidobacteraceae bacterium]
MLITLKSLLRLLLLPPAGPVILALTGVLLARRAATLTARRIGWSLLAGSLAALWLLATPAIADRFERAAEVYPPLDLTRPVQAQAIVILAGGEARMTAPEYGAPAARAGLLERVTYGAYVARRTGLPVLVSGTGREVLAMRATLARNFGIEVRWVEGESRDTFQNAGFSARLLRAARVTRIVLVTSASHEWRAVQEFRSAGFEVVPAPAGGWAPQAVDILYYVPSAAGLQRSADAIYELLGDVARRLFAATRLRRQAR